jgi:hypothetical protein
MKSVLAISIIIVLTILTSQSCKKAALKPVGLGNEVQFSSPILKVGASWKGNMGGLVDVSSSFDTITNTIHVTVKNVSSGKLCWALSEPHLKLVSQTVGELGPSQLGDLLPGEQTSASITVSNDSKYTNYTFDGYVVHIEVYDCNGGVPLPYPNGI